MKTSFLICMFVLCSILVFGVTRITKKAVRVEDTTQEENAKPTLPYKLLNHPYNAGPTTYSVVIEGKTYIVVYGASIIEQTK
jgi:hypothetical protein